MKATTRFLYQQRHWPHSAFLKIKGSYTMIIVWLKRDNQITLTMRKRPFLIFIFYFLVTCISIAYNLVGKSYFLYM